MFDNFVGIGNCMLAAVLIAYFIYILHFILLFCSIFCMFCVVVCCCQLHQCWRAWDFPV